MGERCLKTLWLQVVTAGQLPFVRKGGQNAVKMESTARRLADEVHVEISSAHKLFVLFCFVLFWFGLFWFGLVWFVLICFGLVWFWFGLVWFGLVCFDLFWFGLVWFWFGLAWFGLVWFGLVCLFVCLFVCVCRTGRRMSGSVGSSFCC